MNAHTEPGHRPSDLRFLFRAAWGSLPALLTGSVVACLAASAVLLTRPGVNPLSLLLTAVLVTPASAPLVRAANLLWDGHDVSVREILIALPACWRRGTEAGLVAAVPAALFTLAHELWIQTHQAWLLVSMSAGGAVTVVAVLVAVVALPVSLGDNDAAPRRELWLNAAAATARRPAPAAAAVCLAGLGVWACTTLSASLFLLVPGSVALVSVAAAWTTVVGTGIVTHHPEPTGNREEAV